MKDFGTAVIFFVAFLVIAFLRSGNFATIALALAATGFAGVLVLRFLLDDKQRTTEAQERTTEALAVKML